MKAVITETTNYSAAEKTARFLVYKSFEDLYSDWVEITFPNYQGEALSDYPVLIAISEQAYPGFSYARAGNGDSIAFMYFTPDLQQQPLSFEIDTWNPDGTSLIWVKIPRLFSKEGYAKTTIRMYWHLKEGAEAPGPDPADVWLGYSGVWHFGEAANAGHWEYITWAVSGDKYWLYVKSPTNGDYEEADTLFSPVGEDLEVLAFGADPTGAVASVYGSIDEFRIKPWNLATVGEPTAAELAKVTGGGEASYANETAASDFVHHDFIVVAGVRQNYWITEPSLTKTAWEASAPPEEQGQALLGQPAIGTVNYVCHELFSDRLTLTNELPTMAGCYKKTFSVLDHTDYPSVGATEKGRILLGNDDSMGDWGKSSVTNHSSIKEVII